MGIEARTKTLSIVLNSIPLSPQKVFFRGSPPIKKFPKRIKRPGTTWAILSPLFLSTTTMHLGSKFDKTSPPSFLLPLSPRLFSQKVMHNIFLLFLLSPSGAQARTHVGSKKEKQPSPPSPPPPLPSPFSPPAYILALPKSPFLGRIPGEGGREGGGGKRKRRERACLPSTN